MTKIIPRVHYYLKWSKGEERQIYVRLRSYEQYICKATGVKVRLRDWSQRGEEVKAGDPLARKKNAFLTALRIKIESKLLDDTTSPDPLTIKSILNGGERKKREDPMLTDYIKATYQKKYHGGEITFSTAKAKTFMTNTITACLESIGKKEVRVSELSADVMREVMAEYMRKGNRLSSASTIGVIFRTTAKRAMKDGFITPSRMEEIEEVKTNVKARQTQEDAKKRMYLTEEELRKLESFYESGDATKKEKKTLELFLFSVRECGLRFSDIATLKWANIDFNTKTITKKMIKTGRTLVIPLTGKAERMLADRLAKKKSEYVFELMRPEDMKSDRTFKKRLDNLASAAYALLNNSASKTGLGITLSMHMARHTFATLMANKGTPTPVISRLLGHSSVAVTATYAEILDSTLRKALDDE